MALSRESSNAEDLEFVPLAMVPTKAIIQLYNLAHRAWFVCGDKSHLFILVRAPRGRGVSSQSTLRHQSSHRLGNSVHRAWSTAISIHPTLLTHSNHSSSSIGNSVFLRPQARLLINSSMCAASLATRRPSSDCLAYIMLARRRSWSAARRPLPVARVYLVLGAPSGRTSYVANWDRAPVFRTGIPRRAGQISKTVFWS